MSSIPVTAPCNVCGGTEFGPGPSGRLAITKRAPRCMRCDSLERHRSVRAAFNALPRELLTGTKCLQFSPDPALDRTWFEELSVSVWEGENSLDMQAIALPDASYDWIYSSHVINHVPDEVAALKEMLRVVGDGCIVLSVGGSVFNYRTAPSERVFGRDRQFKLYGTLYADDIQDVLPEVAVLELVAVDPCSVSLDSVYFASRDEARLQTMAAAATKSNVHARVFRAKTPTTTVARPAPRPSTDPWSELRAEISAWRESGVSPRFWARNDDAKRADPLLIELADLCDRAGIPLALAVIPLPMQLDLVELISKRPNLTPLLHGFDHQDRTGGATPKSEFPEDRSPVEAIRSVQLGWYVLEDTFGDRALPVFVPPWGTCAPALQRKLGSLGFVGYSGSRVQTELHRRGTSPAGLRLASAHVAVNRSTRTDPMPERQVLAFLSKVVRAIRTGAEDRDEPIGIMTHHWGVDAAVRAFLERLFDETREAGARWVSARELFMPERA